MDGPNKILIWSPERKMVKFNTNEKIWKVLKRRKWTVKYDDCNDILLLFHFDESTNSKNYDKSKKFVNNFQTFKY